MQRKSSSSVRIYWPEFSREELLRLLTERVGMLREKLPVRLISLFGSYAKSRQTAASDIDLLVVYDGPKRDDDYKLVWETLRISCLQLHIYTAEELGMLVESGSRFPKEAIEKGITVFRA